MLRLIKNFILILFVLITVNSLYAEDKPTVEFMKQYNIETAKKTDLSFRYINTWNMYAGEAKKMGLANADEKDLYFLHRYVRQTGFNPQGVYNIVVANKDYIIHVRKNGEPYQLYAFDENVSQTIFKHCLYVLVDFNFINPGIGMSGTEIDTNSGAVIKSDFTAFENKLKKDGPLNFISTELHFYILFGNKKSYFYSKSGDSYRNLYLLVGDTVLGPMSIY